MSKLAGEQSRSKKHDDELRGRAYEILNESFPNLISTLKLNNERSKLVEEAQHCNTCQLAPPLVVGPIGRLRKLTRKINRLDFSVKSFFRQQFGMRHNNPFLFWTQMQPNAVRFQELLSRQAEYYEDHRKQHRQKVDVESLNQKMSLEEIQLMLNHPVFEDHRRKLADESQNPLKTAELAAKICIVMDVLEDDSDNIKCWLKHLNIPAGIPLLTLADSLVLFCQSLRRTEHQYLINRFVITQRANVCPFILSELRSLDLFENTSAVDWRRFANQLVNRCEQIIRYIINHMHLLDPCQVRGVYMAKSLSALLL